MAKHTSTAWEEEGDRCCPCRDPAGLPPAPPSPPRPSPRGPSTTHISRWLPNTQPPAHLPSPRTQRPPPSPSPLGRDNRGRHPKHLPQSRVRTQAAPTAPHTPQCPSRCCTHPLSKVRASTLQADHPCLSQAEAEGLQQGAAPCAGGPTLGPRKRRQPHPCASPSPPGLSVFPQQTEETLRHTHLAHPPARGGDGSF